MASAPSVVVIGGANIDLKSRTAGPVVMRTSNPGRTRITNGGVARNVAENLTRLGVRTTLLTAVGDDPFGHRLVHDTGAAGVDVSRVKIADAPTGTYTAVLDADGELIVGVAAMEAVESLTAEDVDASTNVIAAAGFVVADCNLSEEALARVLDVCAAARVPMIVDPVSVPKAPRLGALLDGTRTVHTVTPTLDELAALTGGITSNFGLAAGALLVGGVEVVWLRLGAEGSLLITSDNVHEMSALESDVVDVTGAGDAMLAGYVYALVAGATEAEAAIHGHAAAALTIASPDTVAAISKEALDAIVARTR